MKKKSVTFSSWILPIVFTSVILIMTLYESIKELFFKGTLSPWESHIITIIVTAIIATISASIMRSWVFSIYLKEKELEVKEQSFVSFKLILSAVNHIVNNVLNYLQLVKLEVDENGKVSNEIITLLEESINEADKQMKILNKIQKPDDPNSYKDIYPK